MSLEAIRQLGRPLYQPIELAEFAHEPALQPCEERWEMMLPHLPNHGRAIDYGCHTGWFVRKLDKHGLDAYGFDRSEDYLSIAKFLDEGVPGHRAYLNIDLLTYPHIHNIKADVALCLSTAMYLFDEPDKGWDFFRRVSEASPVLFMDFGGQYAGRMPFTEATVVEQMLANTYYTDGVLLGHTSFESRPLFKFWRKP